MAIYHCSVKIIGRNKGRSAVASAAYRSGTKLHSDETDRTFDYTKKGGVVHSEIELCDNAPERFLDRQVLWNEVQTIENKSDSRLAREFEVALPIECNLDEWIEIGRNYAKYLASQGMIVDWSIHNPIDKEKGEPDNPHIHMMATTRPIKENGEWGAKEKKAYKLDKNGERIPIIDPATGQQKIGAKGRKMWQREVVDATGWDSKSKIHEWREAWANTVNEFLDPENQIDHRSYKDQGINKTPTVHEGYAAQKLDKELMKEKGIHAEVVQKNIDIREQNALIVALQELIEKLKVKAGEIYGRYQEAAVGHAGIGNILSRIRGAFSGAQTGKSAFEQRERAVVSIIAKADSREREADELIERISSRRVTAKAAKAKEVAISHAWEISGSDGTHLQPLYEAIGKQLILNNNLNVADRKKPSYAQYDSEYHALVFILKPSQVRKAEKALGDKPHSLIQTEYQGSKAVALVCYGDRYELEEKIKSERMFYLYMKHKPEEPEVQRTKPSIRQTIATIQEQQREQEHERERTPSKPKVRSDDEDLDPRQWSGPSL